MRHSRFYQAGHFSPGDTVELDARVSHYLCHVLRCEVGTVCVLFNGEGLACTATVTQITKKSVRVIIEKESSTTVESPLTTHLYQAFARGEKMDFVIQKAVELGVSSITPLVTERSVTRMDATNTQKKMTHWQGVIISACEQCGRNQLPVLHLPVTLTDVRLSVPGYVLSPEGTVTISSVRATSLALLVGPEGGFSDEEIVWCETQKMTSLRLGPRVLRTETAALSALSIFQANLGDLSL